MLLRSYSSSSRYLATLTTAVHCSFIGFSGCITNHGKVCFTSRGRSPTYVERGVNGQMYIHLVP